MKSACPAITVVLFVVYGFILPGSSMAQTGGESSNAERSDRPGTSIVVPYRSYPQYELDMILTDPERFLGAYIDPQEYVIGPGDRFTVSFVSGDITDITSVVNISGELFFKSVGSVDLTKATLQEALDKITPAVRRSYAESEFAVQLTGFRFVRVNIVGEVTNPGIYYVPAIWRVSEVIDLAGGLTPQALSRKITLSGTNGDIPVDLLRFITLGDFRANSLVCKGRTIIVPNQAECEDFVSISGLVNRPGTFAAVGGDRLTDYIDFAGGLTGSLADMDAHVAGPDGGVKTVLDGAAQATLEYVPAAGENLILTWKDNRRDWGAVSIHGAVVNPGRYPIPGEQFNLKDLLSLCGGVAENGIADMIQIYRLHNPNTHGTALQSASADPADLSANASWGLPAGESDRAMMSFNPREPIDLQQVVLVDGDSLFIPRATGSVSVLGAVASPGLVRYQKGKSAAYYLKLAGGVGLDADKDRIAVINPITGGSIAASNAKELFDGEILFVPRKENTQKR